MGVTGGAKGKASRASVLHFAAAHRTGLQVGFDSAAWLFALLFATAVRKDFDIDANDLRGVLLALPLVVLLQFGAGLLFGLYTGRSRFGSFEEVAGLASATAVTTALLFAVNLALSAAGYQLVPRSAVLAGGITSLVVMGAVRYGWRLLLEHDRRPTGEDCQRLLVFGAGEGAAQVVGAMLADPTSPYLPVALLDDDPAKRKLRIKGVPVLGDRSAVEDVASASGAEALLIAIPTAGAELIADLTARGRQAGLPVTVLPSLSEMMGTDVGVADIRPVTEADLLGRHEVVIDLRTVTGYLTGRRVLVTGAGGSIGSELCRQVFRLAPAELIMVDRDESALHGVQLSIEGRALLDSPDLVLLDIRDRPRLDQLFAERRPEVVFHAAALKHQPLLELHPAEAVKTNVWGTLSVLEAAAQAGVDRFVNISTDKAADPCSVLGYSKRVAERLTAAVAAEAEGTYLSVRFGNVLGSRGSVLGTFQAQVAAGGPVTVTHPDVTRYFMTVEEAVQLVIQAGAIGRSGQALVLDMGDPVRIADVARRLADQSERAVDIVYTGLRQGEKLHEVLLGAGEVDYRPDHPLVSHVEVPPLAGDAVRDFHFGTDAEVIDKLRVLAASVDVLRLR